MLIVERVCVNMGVCSFSAAVDELPNSACIAHPLRLELTPRPLPRAQPATKGTTVTKLAYSVQEAADMIGCSPRTIHTLITNHDLAAFTMTDKPKAKRYIRHDDLVAYVDHCRDTKAA